MATQGAPSDARGGTALRREGLSRHVDWRSRGRWACRRGRSTRHRVEAGPALGDRLEWRGRVPRRRSTYVPEQVPAVERIRLALRAHLRVVAEQLDVATVFTREWRYLGDERREAFVAERRRYEERIRALFREGREQGELRSDLDEGAAGLLFLSAANWAYTWLQAGRDTEELADRFFRLLVDGMRGYSTPA